MPFPSLGKTTQRRAIQQAASNTESNQATVTKTYADALGNITAADVRVKGQVAPLTQVANASGLKLYVGGTVEIRFLNGSAHARQITGAAGGSSAAALSSGTSDPAPLDMASYLAGNAPVLLQSADPGDNPNGYVEAPGANVYFSDTPPGSGSGGAAVNGQRLLTVRPLVATSLPSPQATTLPDGTLLDLVDSYGSPQGMYRLDAGAGVWRRRDAGGGVGAGLPAVTSVAGRTGAVTLSASDVAGLGTAAQANLPAAGSNASSSQVVRGDDTRLGAASLTVQELTTGKSFAGITTIQFPDGTLSLTSAGIVRYTPLSGGAGSGGGKNKANGTTYAAGIARWLCNDPTTGTALVDSISPPGNNLTASATGLFGTDTVGEYFAPGGTGYANGAGNAGLLTGQGDFTFEHYVQTGSSVSGTTFYASQSDLSGTDGGIIFEAGVSGSQFLGFLGTAAGGGAYYQFGSPQTNSLYYIVVVYTASNTTATVYVNGAAIGTQSIGGARAIAGSSTLNRLGDRSVPTSTSAYRWAGKIYFGALYARAMPAAEVQARYTAIG